MPEKKLISSGFCRALAQVIRERREKAGLSLTQLGARAGLSQQSVSYLEREMRSPNIETLLRVADALDVDLSELIKRAETLSGIRRGTRSVSRKKL